MVAKQDVLFSPFYRAMSVAAGLKLNMTQGPYSGAKRNAGFSTWGRAQAIRQTLDMGCECEFLQSGYRAEYMAHACVQCAGLCSMSPGCLLVFLPVCTAASHVACAHTHTWTAKQVAAGLPPALVEVIFEARTRLLRL